MHGNPFYKSSIFKKKNDIYGEKYQPANTSLETQTQNKGLIKMHTIAKTVSNNKQAFLAASKIAPTNQLQAQLIVQTVDNWNTSHVITIAQCMEYIELHATGNIAKAHDYAATITDVALHTIARIDINIINPVRRDAI